ncbi:hypothetical protein P7K49_038186 [Saguinus oedipus]|uniref:Uncharacterized protein n=1 Tax=Saguinus oedipus TaxID=9490 RepID=A0ABQ9TE96_SAGOE|nr:hypothetical protein P7K49_038186 [Saguinus oedipus]
MFAYVTEYEICDVCRSWAGSLRCLDLQRPKGADSRASLSGRLFVDFRERGRLEFCHEEQGRFCGPCRGIVAALARTKESSTACTTFGMREPGELMPSESPPRRWRKAGREGPRAGRRPGPASEPARSGQARGWVARLGRELWLRSHE